jgi:hypothetical protein
MENESWYEETFRALSAVWSDKAALKLAKQAATRAHDIRLRKTKKEAGEAVQNICRSLARSQPVADDGGSDNFFDRLQRDLVAAAEDGAASTRATVFNLQQQLEVTSKALVASQKLVDAAAVDNRFFLNRIAALRKQIEDQAQHQTPIDALNMTLLQAARIAELTEQISLLQGAVETARGQVQQATEVEVSTHASEHVRSMLDFLCARYPNETRAAVARLPPA